MWLTSDQIQSLNEIFTQLVILLVFTTGWFGSRLADVGSRKASAHFINDENFQEAGRQAALSLAKSLLSISTFIPVVVVSIIEGALTSSAKDIFGIFSIFVTLLSVLFLVLFVQLTLPRELHEIHSTKVHSVFGKSKYTNFTTENFMLRAAGFLSCLAFAKLILRLLTS